MGLLPPVAFGQIGAMLLLAAAVGGSLTVALDYRNGARLAHAVLRLALMAGLVLGSMYALHWFLVDNLAANHASLFQFAVPTPHK